jgi:type IV pilus assembly protein PilV
MKNRIKNTPKFSLIKGLSLIEVLVTITITSIGLMGLVSLQMQAVRATNDSGNRSQAVWVFNDIINRIHANEAFSDEYVSDGVIGCAAVTPVCSRYNDGSLTIINPANCTGKQQAAWDNYEVACPLRSGTLIGDANKYLPEVKLSIACVTAGCDAGDPLTITLEWRARASDEEITGADRDVNSGKLTLTDVITP